MAETRTDQGPITLEDVLTSGRMKALDDAASRVHDRDLLRALEQARWRSDLPADTLDGLTGLADRTLDRLQRTPDDEELQGEARRLLDVARRPGMLRQIAERDQVAAWSDRLLALVDASDFTFGRLLEQRAGLYGPRALFRVGRGASVRSVSWEEAVGRVDRIAKGLLALVDDHGEGRIAILSENRLEMALLDLACLAFGLVNVMLPTHSTPEQVRYILGHAGVAFAFVSTRRQLDKVRKVRDELPDLRAVFTLDSDVGGEDASDLDGLIARGNRIPARRLEERRDAVHIGDLATVMYTSGTTGAPKGICFSQRNIVFKRFARALALPDLGEDDVFICYLPLCHTFGRYLEMCGSVFWGATYVFAESPSIETLADQMRRERATVMISIPLKWIQLYELVRQEVDVDEAPAELVEAGTARVTGGRLRWGLSAAGYLDPEVFRFFQSQGVELMSGFGMTEATGGITMTPPGRYRDDSLGCALPGIELRVDDDGELLIRGPYVTIGHLDPPDGAPTLDDAGWFRTGDLMEVEPDGFIRIVDRKKEIYKNVKGETIAPQRVENLFRGFPGVGSVFLVGDHRPYNTALIHPEWDSPEVDLRAMPADELKRHFRDLVVAANGFVAPFERIVDFAVIDRDFEIERGERTAKGTFKRSVIEQNFAPEIARLYRRTWLRIGDVDVMLPNWFFQALGVTASELVIDGDRVTISSSGSGLTIRRLGEGTIRVGSAVYSCPRRVLPLGLMMRAPALRLGNDELVAFAPPSARQKILRARPGGEIEWLRREGPARIEAEEREQAARIVYARPEGMEDLALAARLQGSDDPVDGELAVRILEQALDLDDRLLADTALRLLRRGLGSTSVRLLRRSFHVLAMAERPERFVQTLAAFLDAPEEVLDDTTIGVLARRGLEPERMEAFVAAAEQRCAEWGDGDPTAEALLRFLAAYGAAHPSQYRSLRGFLARMALIPGAPRLRRQALEARATLEDGFHAWLGPNPAVAVDPETGREYRWEDVLPCGRGTDCQGDDCPEEMDGELRWRLRGAVENTPLIRESIFLFSGGVLVSLSDIPPDGIRIKHLGTRSGKSVYRLRVRTRTRGTYDLVVNLARDLTAEAIREETDWLVVCGESRRRGPVAEGFGGLWTRFGLWTEEYVPGQTVNKAVAQMASTSDGRERLTLVWPYAAWAALSAYVDFWDRTWRRTVVQLPVPEAVIVPTHDYHVGARLVALSPLATFPGLGPMLRSMYDSFVAPVEAEHPHLAGLAGWRVIFNGLLEVIGEAEGIELLEELHEDEDEAMGERGLAELAGYLDEVKRRGFLHRRLYFAIHRFQRWVSLNPQATRRARAATLGDLYDNYGLDRLVERYPEARVRLFRDTVFDRAARPLQEALEEIIGRLRSREMESTDLAAAIADRCAHLRSSEDEDYFLARLSFPHLRPEDRAGYVQAQQQGSRKIEMVVAYEDSRGAPFQIRHALNAREVGRLHRLFLRARLPVRFRDEHRFLVAVDDRGRLMGGLAYETSGEDSTAHLEKIVVAEPFQGRKVAHTLLNELFFRLKSAGLTAITTGFFRPRFFHSHGFQVERQHAGLVREL